jgi:hypothetical protein
MIRVQRQVLSIELPARAIPDVSNDGMATMRKLNADLMTTPRAEANLHHAHVVLLGEALPFEHRTLAVGRVGRRYAHVPAVLLYVIDTGANSSGCALNKRQVTLGDRSLTELLTQIPRGSRRPSQYHETRRRSVQSVHEAEECIPRSSLAIGEPVSAQREHVRISGGIRLGELTRRFVHDEHGIVAVYDVKGERGSHTQDDTCL